MPLADRDYDCDCASRRSHDDVRQEAVPQIDRRQQSQHGAENRPDDRVRPRAVADEARDDERDADQQA